MLCVFYDNEMKKATTKIQVLGRRVHCCCQFPHHFSGQNKERILHEFMLTFPNAIWRSRLFSSLLLCRNICSHSENPDLQNKLFNLFSLPCHMCNFMSIITISLLTAYQMKLNFCFFCRTFLSLEYSHTERTKPMVKQRVWYSKVTWNMLLFWYPVRLIYFCFLSI